MASRKLGDLTIGVTADTSVYISGMKDVENATKKTEQKLKNLNSVTRQQKNETAKLRAEIDPLYAAYARLDKLQERLIDQRKRKLIDSDEFDELAGKIENQRKEFETNSKAMGGNVKTARELSFAMRNLPAQFTDIAVAIQGGQRPLTILMQQGGQIKDMFGGIGPAFKFFGQYVLGLINPVNIAALALGTLAVGYAKGSAEAQKFDRALAETNNSIGMSRNELAAMANSLDDVVGTQGKATEVLSQIVTNGKIAEDQLLKIAEAAIRLEQGMGVAIDETIELYGRLSDDPIKVLEELSSKYGFVNAKIYEQVAALIASGNEIEAVKLAVDSVTEAQNRMVEDATENLNILQQFWRNIKTAVSETGDAIANVGRIEDPVAELAAVNEKLADLRAKQEASSTGFFANFRRTRILSLELDKQRLESQVQQNSLLQIEADVQGEITRTQQAGISASAELNRMLEDAASNEERRVKALKDLQEQIDNAASAGIPFSEEDVKKLTDYVESQFEDIKPPKVVDDEAEKKLNSLRQKYAELFSKATGQNPLLPSEKELQAFEQRVRDIRTKTDLTEGDQSFLRDEDALRSQLERNVALERHIERQKELEASYENLADLEAVLNGQGDKNLKILRDRLNAIDKIRASVLGMSDEQYALLQSQAIGLATPEAPDTSGLNLSHDVASERTTATDKLRTRLDSWYDEQIQMLDRNRKEMADRTEFWNEEQLRINAEYFSALKTIEDAEAAEQSRSVGRIFEQFSEQAAKNIHQSFADFLFDPFDKGLKGMAQSFIDTMRRMVANRFAEKLLSGFISSNKDKTNILGSIAGFLAGAREEGGPVSKGKTYLIGEKGAETFVPNVALSRQSNVGNFQGEPVTVGQRGPQLFTPLEDGFILDNAMTRAIKTSKENARKVQDAMTASFAIKMPTGARASGGPVNAGKSYLVGERGSEMFVPTQSGYILNAERTSEVMQGEMSSAKGANVNVNIDATDPGAEARIRSMIEQEMVPQIVELAMGKTISTMRRPRFS